MLTGACLVLTLASLSAADSNVTLLQQNGTADSDSSLNQSLYTGSIELQLLILTRNLCRNIFDEEMKSIGPQQWCNWTIVARPYSDLTYCTEYLMEHLGYYWPNEVGEVLFVQVHYDFFRSCLKNMEPLLSDPPDIAVLGLILSPIGIIPIMVTLVVWCSKNSETNAKK
ncbi:receptor activity-modifying protein 2 isoform X2 [Mobula hypostoma]|uniref:receptor activity-modifying protein 2 isoform X2 n=1 Tax=Mobula hypostoma TaxID=723540 RepID=UPI002FC30403